VADLLLANGGHPASDIPRRPDRDDDLEGGHPAAASNFRLIRWSNNLGVVVVDILRSKRQIAASDDDFPAEIINA